MDTMRITHRLNGRDLELEVEYAYQPKVDPTSDCPGELEYVELGAVNYNELDVGALLSMDELERLEAVVLAKIKESIADKELEDQLSYEPRQRFI